MWDAYNAVVEWVDREANALQGWERLRELWLSGIKDQEHLRTFYALLNSVAMLSCMLSYSQLRRPDHCCPPFIWEI